MVILGIDPGLAVTGWGIVKKQAGAQSSREYVVLDYGCIYTQPHLDLLSRLEILYSHVTSLLCGYRPDVLVVEELFFNTNAKTALIVGHARGVILLAARQHGVLFFEYTPLQVKTAVTGYGRADKSQMQRMVQLLLGLSELPQPDDAADALAVAYCHAVRVRDCM